MNIGNRLLQRAPALLPAMRRNRMVVAMAKQNNKQGKKEGGGTT